MSIKNTLLFLSVLNLTIFGLIFTNSVGITNYNKEIIFSLKDSYVFNELSHMNYGSSKYMHCGNYNPENSFALRKKYAFIYFDISSVESSWEMVSLSLTVTNIAKPLDLDIYIVNEYWSEELITWDNKPSNFTYSHKSLNFTTNGKYIFNLTELISPSIIALNIMLFDYDIEDVLFINSKEYPDQKTHPQLVFHYPNFSARSNLSNYFRLIILIFGCFIGFIYILMMILKRTKTKRNSD